MKGILKKTLNSLSSNIPLDYLVKFSNKKLILPFYHTISDTYLPHVSPLYAVRTTQQFRKDLDYICKYFRPITLQELTEIVLYKKEITEPVFHLTFDDGLREIYSVIAPVLEEKNIPATIFLNTDFIDNKNLFYRFKAALILDHVHKSNISRANLSKVSAILKSNINQQAQFISAIKDISYTEKETLEKIGKLLEIDFNAYLKQEKPYLSISEIKDIQSRGFTFGSHSKNHPLFKDLSFEEQKVQVADSFKYLQKQFNIQYNYFSFPFSDDGVKKDFYNWLSAQKDFKLSFGTGRFSKDSIPFNLHRFSPEAYTLPIEKQLHTEYCYYFIKQILGKNLISR